MSLRVVATICFVFLVFSIFRIVSCRSVGRKVHTRATIQFNFPENINFKKYLILTIVIFCPGFFCSFGIIWNFQVPENRIDSLPQCGVGRTLMMGINLRTDSSIQNHCWEMSTWNKKQWGWVFFQTTLRFYRVILNKVWIVWIKRLRILFSLWPRDFTIHSLKLESTRFQILWVLLAVKKYREGESYTIFFQWC